MTHLVMFDKPDENKVKQEILKIIQPHFKFNINQRISVRADVKQFKIKEDEGVWAQAKGKRPHYFEIYWDGEWISDFDTQTIGGNILYSFLKGFAKKYEDGLININTADKYKEIEEKQNTEKMIEDAIKEQKTMLKKDENEDVASNVVVELLEDKKEKIKKTKKKMQKIYGDI